MLRLVATKTGEYEADDDGPLLLLPAGYDELLPTLILREGFCLRVVCPCPRAIELKEGAVNEGGFKFLAERGWCEGVRRVMRGGDETNP